MPMSSRAFFALSAIVPALGCTASVANPGIETTAPEATFPWSAPALERSISIRDGRSGEVLSMAQLLDELAQIMDHHAEPELAIHFHIYCHGQVLLQWHDAFDDPILVSGAISEEKVRILARENGKGYKRIVE